tara:strand:+ start:1074 stop:1805 length:732 start_codon:yes stop_codon:yes gene_type:complete
MISNLNNELSTRVSTLDIEQLQGAFIAQDEFVQVENFLPPSLAREMLDTLPSLETLVHRNYIPGHKKGGSIGRFEIDSATPLFSKLYKSPALIEFLERLCGNDLIVCPSRDQHSYALYYYTEPGDHIGYHYDTSYYKGTRYTVLIGLVSAPSCLLQYQLHTRNPKQEMETSNLELQTGTLVFFNGDKLRHRITPLGANERRVALTLEFLTNAGMHPLMRFVSNMKDAIAYFGFKQVFKGPRQG